MSFKQNLLEHMTLKNQCLEWWPMKVLKMVVGKNAEN